MTCQICQRYHSNFFECNAIYVEDVEDRSNTPKGCSAMYVEDVEDGKRTYRHIFIITFLIWYHLNLMLYMSKMDFQSPKSFGKLELRAFQPYHQTLCILKHVKDVEDNLRHLQHALIYTVFDGMVGKP